MTLMFQKEVAERLVAAPRSPAYGRLSVLTQWLCQPRPLFDIPPRAFPPPPQVVSTVVAVTPRAEPLAPGSLGVLEKVTAAARAEEGRVGKEWVSKSRCPLLPTHLKKNKHNN